MYGNCKETFAFFCENWKFNRSNDWANRFCRRSASFTSKQKSNFSLYSRCYTEACNEFCMADLSVIVSGQQRLFQRNVAAATSLWRRCVQSDRPKIWTSDLPLQRRTRYPSTNWPLWICILLKIINYSNMSAFPFSFIHNGIYYCLLIRTVFYELFSAEVNVISSKIRLFRGLFAAPKYTS